MPTVAGDPAFDEVDVMIQKIVGQFHPWANRNNDISPNDDNAWTKVGLPVAGMKADRLKKVTGWLASQLSDTSVLNWLCSAAAGSFSTVQSGLPTGDTRVTPRDRFVV